MHHTTAAALHSSSLQPVVVASHAKQFPFCETASSFPRHLSSFSKFLSSSAAPLLSSGSLLLPQRGDCAHDGGPFSQTQPSTG
jgi:hypothetical protein